MKENCSFIAEHFFNIGFGIHTYFFIFFIDCCLDVVSVQTDYLTPT